MTNSFIIDHQPTFCTLFLLWNAALTKDVGLINYGMGMFGGYDAFGTVYPDIELPNLKYIPGFRLEIIPKITGNQLKDQLLWLKKNAKRIDVLNVYHMNSTSFAKVLIYKLFNPKGKVYLKLDRSVHSGTRMPFLKWAASYLNWRKPAFFMLRKMCTIISTEFPENIETLHKWWPNDRQKIICVPNPLNPNEIREYSPFSKRSNVILTVGRLGTKPKATEILLEAFAKIADKIPNWKLKLAGDISENMNIADDFFAKYPDLKEQVIFTGNIVDREEMTETYRDAKIFAFPSRHESWGIALTEAMMNGCFCITSRIPSSMKLTENFKFVLCHDVDDVDGLAENLLYACTHESEIESLAIKGREATLRRCDLKRISENIAEELKRT